MYEILKDVYKIMQEHPEYLAAGIWIFNAAAQTMPTPREGGSQLYVWAFNFAHLLAGNIGLLGKKKMV